jgi:hypothetical protein
MFFSAFPEAQPTSDPSRQRHAAMSELTAKGLQPMGE